MRSIKPFFRAGLDDWLRHRPRTTVVAIGLGLVAALGYADASVAPDLAPLVYLAPIALVAWYAGRSAGALMALTGTGAWLLTDAAARRLPTATAPARIVVQKLREALSDVVVAHGWRLTASIGVVTYLVPPASVDAMIGNVDHLMYTAKQGGKNAVQHATAN